MLVALEYIRGTLKHSTDIQACTLAAIEHFIGTQMR